MKRTKATRYVGLDARSAAELGELLTAKCEELREFKPEIMWNLGNGNSAFLVYDELFEEPENAKDRFILKGDVHVRRVPVQVSDHRRQKPSQMGMRASEERHGRRHPCVQLVLREARKRGGF